MKENRIQEAFVYFSGNCNCCQSIIMTYGPHYGFSKEIGIRLGTGFAGGIARHGEVCGAVSGSIMIIGLAQGMENEADLNAREKTYELVNDFLKRFREKNASITCRELLDCDISTPEGRKEAKEKGLFETKCPDYVQTAAEILEEIL
jgi:C_GCAxxG_C_C family probable redox protein